MNHLRVISGSIWGPTLKTMKQLYVTKIRPIITYACGAWFIPIHKEVNWGISQKRLEILESLQYQCLLQISGAMRGTSRLVLEKELNIDSIRMTLCRLAATHRTKMIDTPDHDALVKARTSLSKPGDLVHPYTLLDWVEEISDSELGRAWWLMEVRPWQPRSGVIQRRETKP